MNNSLFDFLRTLIVICLDELKKNKNNNSYETTSIHSPGNSTFSIRGHIVVVCGQCDFT
jgi:hypothetical protein